MGSGRGRGCTYLLADGERLETEMEVVAAAILSDSGWRMGEERPGSDAVSYVWWLTQRTLQVLGGIVTRGGWQARTLRLTDFGKATLFEQIRVMATGPQLFSN